MRAIFAAALLVFELPGLVAAQSSPAASPSPSPTPSPEDAALLKEIEAATAAPPAASPVERDVARGSSGSFLSNAYNPAMSVNGLFLGSSTSRKTPAEGETPNALGIQELEVQFLANVDPYFQANLILAMPGGEGIELEEGYLSPTWQPAGLAFRVGKIKTPFGRENTQHTHALPFVEKSLAGSVIFGEEGLSEPSLEVSYLTPLPWYAIVTASLMSGDNEAAFASPRDEDYAGFAGLKNVFDVTDDATLEAGASYAAGNDADYRLAQVVGGHLILKWKPARAATTRSALLGAEVLYAHLPNDGADPAAPRSANVGGAWAYAQWQLAKRWYSGARFDYLGFNAGEAGITRRGSAILVFAPTEFSAVRLQASAVQPPDPDADLAFEGFLQLNFTLGAHPAHAY